MFELTENQPAHIYPFIFNAAVGDPEIPEETFDEIKAWCKEQFGEPVHRDDLRDSWVGNYLSDWRHYFCWFGFSDENHAMLFKLRWCGVYPFSKK